MGIHHGFARLAACFALGASSVGASAADEPLIMTPSSQWVADYDDDSCALRRGFEGDGEQASLELRQFVPDDDFRGAIMSSTLPRTRHAPRLRFGSDADFVEPENLAFIDREGMHGARFTSSLRPDWKSRRQSPDVPSPWSEADREAREAEVTAFSVTALFDRTLVLQTGPMRPPMEAMRACLDDLLTQWGLDAAVQRTLSRRVTPIEQRKWARRVVANYPTDMLRAGRSGKVHLRVIVDADGTLTACVPYDSPPDNGSFDRSACDSVMKFARFEPALDAKGVPVASYFATTVTYWVR